MTTTIKDRDGIEKTVGSSGQVQGPAFREAIQALDEGVESNICSKRNPCSISDD